MLGYMFEEQVRVHTGVLAGQYLLRVTKYLFKDNHEPGNHRR